MKAVSGENKNKAALKSTQTIYHQKTIEMKADCAYMNKLLVPESFVIFQS